MSTTNNQEPVSNVEQFELFRRFFASIEDKPVSIRAWQLGEDGSIELRVTSAKYLEHLPAEFEGRKVNARTLGGLTPFAAAFLGVAG